MGRTVIIGAGAIGLATGVELQRRGEEVVILDRGEPGMAASYGNAGWITPSISYPLPAPGLVGTSIKWMLRSDSPLYIKPRLDPRFALWLLDFWRNCNPKKFREGIDAFSALNDRTMPLFDQWQSEGMKFEMHCDGLLFIGMNREAVERAAEETGMFASAGYSRPKVVAGAELRELEPELSPDVAAGFLVKEERHIRPDEFTIAMVDRLREGGAEIRPGVLVTGIERRGSKVTAVQTSSGTIAADNVMMANGAWMGRLAKRFGFSIPMEAGKGYSITIDNPERQLQHSIDFVDARVAVTPFESKLRLAGTMELSGLNLRLEKTRVEAIRRAVTRYIGAWAGEAEGRVWVGMRPLTPDGMPVIGRINGTDNLYAAGGHQMLGITAAPATGEVMAELIMTGKSRIDLRPFDPSRFRGGSLN